MNLSPNAAATRICAKALYILSVIVETTSGSNWKEKKKIEEHPDLL